MSPELARLEICTSGFGPSNEAAAGASRAPAVYLAARYSRRGELAGYADELRALGFEVTSRWLLGGHQAENDDPERMAEFALDDHQDLLAADWVVSFTEEPRQSSTSRGGRHVEFGLAFGLGKRLVVVGWKENVFHALPSVEFCADWQEARRLLAGSVTPATVSAEGWW